MSISNLKTKWNVHSKFSWKICEACIYGTIFLRMIIIFIKKKFLKKEQRPSPTWYRVVGSFFKVKPFIIETPHTHYTPKFRWNLANICIIGAFGLINWVWFGKWSHDLIVEMGAFIVPCASVQEVSLVCWSILMCNIRELVMIFCVYADWNECGKSSWNITLPFSFLPWIVVFYFGKMSVKSCRTLEINGETFLMPKLFIVFPTMFFTFPTNTLILTIW